MFYQHSDDSMLMLLRLRSVSRYIENLNFKQLKALLQSFNHHSDMHKLLNYVPFKRPNVQYAKVTDRSMQLAANCFLNFVNHNEKRRICLLLRPFHRHQCTVLIFRSISAVRPIAAGDEVTCDYKVGRAAMYRAV